MNSVKTRELLKYHLNRLVMFLWGKLYRKSSSRESVIRGKVTVPITSFQEDNGVFNNENKTFCGGLNSNLNATVGFNGSDRGEEQARSNKDYAVGYVSAAINLLEIAIEAQEIRNSPDYLVYPICFNMRHALELYLKKFWEDLSRLSQYRIKKLTSYRDEKCKIHEIDKQKLSPFPDIDSVNSHNISILWMHICEYAPIIDDRFKPYIDMLSGFINDIADLDSSGQTFRYPSSNESEVHLSKTPLINMEILKLRFNYLQEVLEAFDLTLEQLIYEYSWTDYTNNLSYFDLYKISKKLGEYKGREKPCYAEAAKDIRCSYKLSGREYSQAINVLRKDRVLSHGFDTEQQLVHLNTEDITNYLNIWLDEETKTRVISSYEQSKAIENSFVGIPNVDEIITRNTHVRNSVLRIRSEFDLKKLAELYTLYYFAREEPLHNIYLRVLRDTEASFTYMIRDNCEEELLDNLRSLFTKVNFLENLISSLWVLNCKHAANSILETFKLSDLHFWKEIKAGQTFSPFRELESYERKIDANLAALELVNMKTDKLYATE